MSVDARFWRETEGLLERSASPSGYRTTPEDRKNDRFWRETDELLDRMEDERMEEAADRIDEASAGWTDWRGFPLEGFESSRFLTEREREYKRWYRGSSPEAARVRRIHEGGA
jgi:hypothetical protein